MEILALILVCLAVGTLIGAPVGYASGREDAHTEHNKRMGEIRNG